MYEMVSFGEVDRMSPTLVFMVLLPLIINDTFDDMNFQSIAYCRAIGIRKHGFFQ
jgi:hypothetical protein